MIYQSESSCFVADWLIDLESVTYRDHFAMDYGHWQELTNETRASLESSLRITILRSALSLPENAPLLSLIAPLPNDHMRRKDSDQELIGFSPILSTVAPEKLVMLARAELLETLPMDEIEQERRDSEQYYQLIKQIRDKPKEERTEHEQKILAAPHYIKGTKTYDLDDLGIDQYHHAYFPPSPLHEPFGSLFRNAPDLARARGRRSRHIRQPGGPAVGSMRSTNRRLGRRYL